MAVIVPGIYYDILSYEIEAFLFGSFAQIWFVYVRSVVSSSVSKLSSIKCRELHGAIHL